MRKVIYPILVVAMSAAGCNTLNSGASAPPVEDLDDPGNAGAVMAPTPPPEPGLPLSAEQRFSDIPLPTDLQQDIDRTFVFENKTLQIGRMVYTTRAATGALAQFFIRECPAADWELDSVTQSAGAKLIFLKPGKRLEINIRELGVTRGRELIITMTPETD